MTSYSNLVLPRTKEELRARLLQALRGVGFVKHTGAGTGMLDGSGAALGDYSVIIEIVSSGEIGVGTFRYSTDGGSTWSDPATIPAALTALASVGTPSGLATGASIQFGAGTPEDGDSSFVAGDRYSFLVATPTLPTTAWQPFSTPLALLEAFAEAFEDLDGLLAVLGAGGWLSSATGLWLDLLGQNVYDEVRKAAVSSKHTFHLADTAGTGPHTIQVGQLWVRHASGLRFRNTTGGTLAKSGTLDLVFQAEKPGAAYNIGAGSSLALETTLAGVTVTNPGTAGSSLVQVGADRESDALYADRCAKKWQTLGSAANDDGYAFWALSASETITRAMARAGENEPGNVEVYVAGPTGGAPVDTAAAMSEIEPHVPTCVTASVAQANDQAIAIRGTVRVKAALLAVAQGEVESALAAYAATIPIGGVEVGSEHIVSKEKIEALITGATGVLDYDPVLPADDTPMGAIAIPVFVLDLTWVTV